MAAKATEFQEQARLVQYVPWQPRFQLGLEKELDSEPGGTRTPQEGTTDGNRLR